MNPISHLTKTTSLLLVGLLSCMFLLTTACDELTPEDPQEEPQEKLADRTVNVSALSAFYIASKVDSCIQSNPDDKSECDSLRNISDEANRFSELVTAAFRKVDPEPTPLPEPPDPCPQGQCLDIFKSIVALVYPVKQGILEIRLVVDGKVLSSASVDNKDQSLTLFDGEMQALLLEGVEIPQDVPVNLDLVFANAINSIPVY